MFWALVEWLWKEYRNQDVVISNPDTGYLDGFFLTYTFYRIVLMLARINEKRLGTYQHYWLSMLVMVHLKRMFCTYRSLTVDPVSVVVVVAKTFRSLSLFLFLASSSRRHRHHFAHFPPFKKKGKFPHKMACKKIRENTHPQYCKTSKPRHRKLR